MGFLQSNSLRRTLLMSSLLAHPAVPAERYPMALRHYASTRRPAKAWHLVHLQQLCARVMHAASTTPNTLGGLHGYICSGWPAWPWPRLHSVRCARVGGDKHLPSSCGPRDAQTGHPHKQQRGTKDTEARWRPAHRRGPPPPRGAASLQGSVASVDQFSFLSFFPLFF